MLASANVKITNAKCSEDGPFSLLRGVVENYVMKLFALPAYIFPPMRLWYPMRVEKHRTTLSAVPYFSPARSIKKVMEPISFLTW